MVSLSVSTERDDSSGLLWNKTCESSQNLSSKQDLQTPIVYESVLACCSTVAVYAAI